MKSFGQLSGPRPSYRPLAALHLADMALEACPSFRRVVSASSLPCSALPAAPFLAVPPITRKRLFKGHRFRGIAYSPSFSRCAQLDNPVMGADGRVRFRGYIQPQADSVPQIKQGADFRVSQLLMVALPPLMMADFPTGLRTGSKLSSSIGTVSG
jgi:hypothetical protein